MRGTPRIPPVRRARTGAPVAPEPPTGRTSRLAALGRNVGRRCANSGTSVDNAASSCGMNALQTLDHQPPASTLPTRIAKSIQHPTTALVLPLFGAEKTKIGNLNPHTFPIGTLT